MTVKTIAKITSCALVAAAILAPASAQDARPGRAPAEFWWANKTKGGVYHAPMRPLWKLSDLKKLHAGRSNWQEQIVKDPEQDATYNSAAPGTKISSRMHPDTPTIFIVVAGEMHFTVEGQQPVTATRGSIVNIQKTTVYGIEVAGAQNALWLEVDPPNYQTVYPAADPAPKPLPGAEIVKVSFPHTPGAYTPPNQPHWNLFDAIAKCAPAGPVVYEDHLFANPLVGYANAADNKCPGGGRGNTGGGGGAAAFNPRSTFGHMHPGPAEWWLVQVGGISGKFENAGEFHAEEGDILYAAPMSWHQMGVEGASGPSVRLALGGYNLINMNNTAGAAP